MFRFIAQRWRLTACAAVLLGSLAGPGVHAAGAGHPRRFTLWLDWYPNSDHAGIYVALARGYYAQAGLDVHPQVPSGAADGLKLVAHGSGDMVISYEPDVLQAQAVGVPVRATAAIVHAPLTCILTLRTSGITRPRQLVGKTVGVAGLPSDSTNVTAMVSQDGGDPRAVRTIIVNYSLLQAELDTPPPAMSYVTGLHLTSTQILDLSKFAASNLKPAR